LPPHEREWRHPSELPAPAHEPPTRAGRLLIVATGAIGLALVGVLAIRMTPGRTPPGDALVVSTSSVLTSASGNSFGELAGAATSSGRRFTDLVGRALSSLVASADRSDVTAATISVAPSYPTGLDDASFAVVTPIGDDGLGVTTAAAVEGRSGAIQAMLPSGAIVTVELVGTDNGVAVVSLPEMSTSAAARLAESPADDWTVVAFGDEYAIDGGGRQLRSLSVPEAAPIFDADGALVGLCTIGPDGVELLPVTSLPDVAPLPTDREPDSTDAVTEPTDSAITPPTEPVEDTRPAAPVSSSSTVAPASTAPDSTTVSSSEPPSSTAPDTSEAPSTT
jgi:hypothetical protein